MQVADNASHQKEAHSIALYIQGVGVASVKVFSPDELKDRLRRQLQMEQQVVEQHVMNYAKNTIMLSTYAHTLIYCKA